MNTGPIPDKYNYAIKFIGIPVVQFVAALLIAVCVIFESG